MQMPNDKMLRAVALLASLAVRPLLPPPLVLELECALALSLAVLAQLAQRPSLGRVSDAKCRLSAISGTK